MNQGHSGDDGAARGGRPLRTWIVVALLTLAGLAASIAGFIFVNRWSTERAEADFHLAAQERIAAVRREIGVHFEALYALGSLFDSSTEVDEDEFKVFASATLRRNPGLSGLAFVRRIPAAQRELAELELGQPIMEQTTEGAFRPAGERDVYYPFWFAHTADDLAPPHSVDLAAEPNRAAALERAIRSGEIELTGPVRIMVFPEFRSGIVALLPLYERLPDGARGEVYGAVTAAVTAHEVIHAAVGALGGGGVELHVHDVDPRGGPASPLYIHPIGAPPPTPAPSTGEYPIPTGRHIVSVTQNVGGRTWILTAVPDHPLGSRSWEAWGVLGAGLLLTALAAMNVATTISRHGAERLVRERTAALADRVQQHEQAQARLAESELRFRQLADNIDAVFWMVSGTPPRIEYISPAFDRIWGQPAAELLRDRGRYFASIHPDDRTTVEGLVAVQGKAPFDVEYRIVRPDGSIRWIRDRSVPITPGPSGPRAAGIAEDITDRKRAEQALQDSEARQRAVLAAIPDCMFRMARDGTYLDYHAPEGMPLLVPPERFLGRRCEDVLPLSIYAPTLQAIEGALRTGQLHTFEYTGTGENPRRWEVRVIPCGEDEVLAIVRDVSEQRRAQEALRASEARYRLIVETAHEGIWTIDADGRTTFVNARMAEMLGTTVEDMLGKTMYDFMDDAGRAIAEQNMERRRMGIREEHDFRFVRADGVPVWTMLSTSPLLDDQGRFLGALAMVTDITGRQQAEEELRRSEELNRRIIEALPGGLVMVGPNGSIHQANSEAEAFLGLTWDRLSRRFVADFEPETIREDGSLFPVDDYPVTRCLRTGRSQPPATIGVRRPDGSVRWGIFTAVPLLSPAGEPEGAVVTFLDITDRKHAEEALRTNEERYRIIAEQTGQVIYDYAVATGAIVWAGAIQAVTGFSAEDFARLNVDGWADLLHPEDRPAVTAELDRVLRMGGHFRMEYRFRCADGRYATILDNGVLIDAGTPNPRLLGAMQDITERVAAEEVLRESEERYRLLAENATDMISRRTPEGVFLYASPACRALLGYEPEELLGRTIHDLADPPAPPPPPDPRPQLPADAPPGGTSVVRTRVRRKDGQTVWLETTSRAVVNPWTGAVREVVAVSRDITERMNADRALRESEERFRSLSTCSPVGIFMSTSRGSLTWVNPRLLEIAGLAYDEALGDGWAARVHPNDAPWLRQGWRRAAADARSFSAEFRFQHRTGDIRWVRATTSPMFADSGELVGHVGALEDITDRKLAEQALRDSEERYRRLVETSPDGIFVHQDGRVVFANAAAARLLGAPSPAELIGTPIAEFIHPSVIDEVRSRLRRLGEGAENVPPLDQTLVRLSKDTLDAEIAASACMYSGRPAVQVVARDITQRKAAEARLRFQASVLSQVDDAVIALDDAKRITYLNAAAARIYGVNQPDMIGRHISELFTQQWLRPSDEANAAAELRARGRWEGLSLHVKPSGDRIYVESAMSTLRDDRGRHAGVLAVVRDVSDRIRWEQRQSLMMAELDHRVKNNLAAVLSIADQTLRSASSLADFGEAFTGRIRALARMHGALAQSRWKGANLADLARQSLEAYMVGNGRRVFIDGPDVLLPARAASPVCMALHELATNAAKYGALSVPSGRVDVRWSLADPDPDAPDAPRRVDLQWTESGGPPVAEPHRRGFGTELIEGGIAYELHGDVEITFHPRGFACRMTIPLEDEPDRLTPQDPHHNGAPA